MFLWCTKCVHHVDLLLVTLLVLHSSVHASQNAALVYEHTGNNRCKLYLVRMSKVGEFNTYDVQNIQGEFKIKEISNNG